MQVARACCLRWPGGGDESPFGQGVIVVWGGVGTPQVGWKRKGSTFQVSQPLLCDRNCTPCQEAQREKVSQEFAQDREAMEPYISLLFCEAFLCLSQPLLVWGGLLLDLPASPSFSISRKKMRVSPFWQPSNLSSQAWPGSRRNRCVPRTVVPHGGAGEHVRQVRHGARRTARV